jgi:hypothetical protein
MQDTTERKDVYSRITAQIVEHLEKGVRPWIRPWNAEHAAGRITRPLRHNGQPYSGINILSLWMSALGQNFAAPTRRKRAKARLPTVWRFRMPLAALLPRLVPTDPLLCPIPLAGFEVITVGRF